MDTCHVCGAEHYADTYCIWCWLHICILGWTEAQCAALEATIAQVTQQAKVKS